MREPANQQVVLLSGPIASGKTTLARSLEQRFGFCVVNTRELLLRQGGKTAGPFKPRVLPWTTPPGDGG